MVEAMIITNNQVKDLAKPLVEILIDFYNDPKNRKGYEKWLKKRKESVQTSSSSLD